MGPIQDRIGNGRWLARALCVVGPARAWRVCGTARCARVATGTSYHPEFQKLAPPKTDAFKPQRSDWKPYKKLQGHAVYRHADEVNEKVEE